MTSVKARRVLVGSRVGEGNNVGLKGCKAGECLLPERAARYLPTMTTSDDVWVR